ncbi:hypothetical protein ASG90_00125 [Nocardioides sp. Soil797]|nr:hypothetical protein ASG90_00125 [Nocardioides sp. Soil797]
MPDLHDRIDGLFGDEPEHRPLDVHLAEGHKALRRRRAASGVGALVVLAVLGGTGYAVQGHSGDGRDAGHDTVASPTADPEPPDADQTLVEACHDADNRNAAATYLWRGGEPEVMASLVTWDDHTRAYLRSGNRKYWGECYVAPDGDGALAPAFRIDQDPDLAPQGGGYGIGQACAANRYVVRDCRTFVASQDGRRDPEVARVEARFMDGQWERTDTNEGYYFLEHVGNLPDDITWDKDGQPVRDGNQIDDVINRIKLFNADGELIAYWDASQNANGPNRPNDKGVAELDAYPLIQSRLAGPDGDHSFP